MTGVTMRIWSYWVLLIVGLAVGCGSQAADSDPTEVSYRVGGKIVDQDDVGLSDVPVEIGDSVETTDANGEFRADVSGSVVVRPTLDYWTFDPEDIQVSESAEELEFVGTPEPTELEIVDGSIEPGSDFGVDRVNLDLKNHGAAGDFIVQAWKRPSVPGQPREFIGESQPTDVGPGWSGDGSWEFDHGTTTTSTSLDYATIICRNEGESEYRETAEIEFE